MNRISKCAAAIVLIGMMFGARAETLQTDAAGFPSFAIARLSINKMGVFLDQNGAYANHISPNIGPLAKVALANALFKLPVDESLNFEGPAQIYLIAPITLGANQDTATILPVVNTEKLTKNIIAIFGDAETKDGVMTFTVPQPLPQPDKSLLLKITGGKALLAPNLSVLKQLEAAASAPAAPADSADATLAISVPAIQRMYGVQIDGALQAGALLASESVEGLKKVTDQLDAIIKGMWQIGTIEARVTFDKDSKSATGELALVPLKDSRLADMFANPPAGLNGKDTQLLDVGAPINAAFKLNGPAIRAFLNRYGIKPPETSAAMDQALFDQFDGENMLAFDSQRVSLLHAQKGSDAATATKKIEAIQNALVDMIAAAMKETGALPKGTIYTPLVETAPYKGAPITLRKVGSHEGVAKLNPMVHDDNGYVAHAVVNGHWICGVGVKPDESIKRLIDRWTSGGGLKQDSQGASNEERAAFASPPPGTLVLLSVKLLDVATMFSGDLLGDNIMPEQITGGLPDDPVFISAFANEGKIGLRATLPGTTAGSIYAVTARLRRHGVNVFEMMGLGGAKKSSGETVPGNVPPPPPEK